ncbi:hypothetical protein ElyMa_003615600 [Elysia marginata]|uniref:CARMIL pleckstrin homology domain-containing protein n=1 Tax=Elysia marginata TaxID=1093978 RepID=A0AAV4ESR2_9GAST|nr:hypothetical protein ElyMa_003615600 [Elysia marginata]
MVATVQEMIKTLLPLTDKAEIPHGCNRLGGKMVKSWFRDLRINRATISTVYYRNELQFTLDTQVEVKCTSDHFVITVKTSLQKCSAKKTVIVKRDMKHINPETFRGDISNCLSAYSPFSVDELIKCLKGVLNEHAPMEEQTISSRPVVPWMSLTVKEAK